jgi:hypothetical protein
VTSKIRDPSKMTGFQVCSLLNYWLKHQVDGQVVFQFKKVDETHIHQSFGQRKSDHDSGGKLEIEEDGEGDEESMDWETALLQFESDDEAPDLTWR